MGHSPSHHLPPGARQGSGRQSVLQPLLKDKLGNGKGRGRGISASKAPPREAAGTGHLCSVQPANSADSGMQSPRKQGLWHVLAPAGQCFPDPSAQQTAKRSLGLNTCPTTGATAGQGAARQDRFLPLFCPGLIDWLMLGKTRMPMEQHQGRGKGEQTPAGAAAAAVAEMS